MMPAFRALLAALLTGGFLLLLPGNAAAQSLFERLVMPGDLIEGHAKLEKECDNCHVSFSQGAQSGLCAACHKEVARDISEATGFHGRAPQVRRQECRQCHTDHIGRAADIVGLDRETFLHGVTDFTLDGAHAEATCVACHAPEKKFREAAGTCFGCHEQDEPHKTRLGRECEICHRTTAWTDTRPFDHSKTKFTLVGAHDKARCSACHAGEVYADLPRDCIACHRIRDVHAGAFGTKCDLCHAPAKWTEIRFDHDRNTKFTLIGKHAETRCNKCHAADVPAADAPTDCFGCHKTDDPHQGKLGRKCDSCHTPEGWRQDVAFDHDITRFPLIGLHVLVPCEECHLDAGYRGTDRACTGCHSLDDVHDRSLGAACESCHNPNGWAFWKFDHDTRTDYPLTGAHAGLQCAACHSPNHKPAPKPPKVCASCHARNDVHRGAFGKRCDQCHGTDRWKGARLKLGKP